MPITHDPLHRGLSAAVRGRVGYMPEQDCLPTPVSAAEFLTHMAEVSGLPPAMARTHRCVAWPRVVAH